MFGNLPDATLFFRHCLHGINVLEGASPKVTALLRQAKRIYEIAPILGA